MTWQLIATWRQTL